MTVRNIELYPTGDIHLLLEGPHAPTTYQLVVRDYADADDDLSGLEDRTKYTEFNALVASVSPTGLITPVSVGETLCRIRHTDTDPNPPNTVFLNEVIIRIRVHRRLEEIWFGNNRATLFDGQSNYLLTVFGAFDDGTIGDISSHPYLTFDSADPNTVDVDSGDDRGRLSGLEVTGANPVRIAVVYGTLSDEIDVEVLPALTEARHVLERIHGAGPATDRRNLLFLAEGFPPDQRQLFRKLVTLIKDEFFASRINSPFDVLKDRFNVWMAFDPSSEEGVTPADFMLTTGAGNLGLDVAEPVSEIEQDPEDSSNYDIHQLVLRVGYPDRYLPFPTTREEAEKAWEITVGGTDFDIDKVEDVVVTEWLKLKNYYFLQARDSLLGLINGGRYGDVTGRRINPAAPAKPLMHWYQPEAARMLVPDRRRMARAWNQRAFVNRYVTSLRPIGSNTDVTGVWTGNGRDRQLIVCLVNTAYRGGTRSDFGLALSDRQDTKYLQVHRSDRKADHSLPDIEVLSFPSLLGASLDSIVSTFAHELSHAFQLGDEYEAAGLGGTQDVLNETDTAARASIEEDLNLVHHYTIRAPAPQIININLVKWRLWHRIEKCSVLTADPVSLGGGRLRVPIAAADRAKWDTDNMHNIEVFLRSRSINADLATHSGEPAFILEGPLKILEIESSGSLIVATTFITGFKADDIIYLPQVAGGKPLTVFHPNVLGDLEAIGAPFAAKTDPSKPNLGPAYPPLRALGQGFEPRHAAFVVGVYEGGGEYNTRVYRPAGTCKMRRTRRGDVLEKPIRIEEQGIVVGPEVLVTRFLPFCFVCRYALVNLLDPVRLESLSYPE